MTIAKQILNGQTRWDKEIIANCEKQAVATEQDFGAGTTTYVFSDGSKVVWESGEVVALDK